MDDYLSLKHISYDDALGPTKLAILLPQTAPSRYHSNTYSPSLISNSPITTCPAQEPAVQHAKDAIGNATRQSQLVVNVKRTTSPVKAML